MRWLTVVLTVRRNEFDTEIRLIAVPAFATLALEPIMSMVDAAFVGRLGAAELGGVGIAGMILRFATSMFTFLVASITPIVAASIASGDPDATSRSVSGALWVAAGGGTALAALLLGFAPQLVSFFSGTQAASPLHAAAVTYLRIRALALPAVLCAYASAGAFRGFLDTRTPLAVSIIANLVNLGGDAALIMGLGWGVAGAAWATVASQVASALGLVTAFVWQRKVRLRHLRQPPSPALLKHRGRWWRHLQQPPSPALLKHVLSGSVLSVRSLAILGTFSLATAQAAALGAVPSAAYEICRQAWMFCTMALDALAVAAVALVAQALRARDAARCRALCNRMLQRQCARDAARCRALCNRLLQAVRAGDSERCRALCNRLLQPCLALSNRLLQLGLIFATALGVLLAAGRHAIPRVFTNDPAVIAAAAAALPIFALCEPLCGLVFVWDGIFAAAEDYKYVAGGVAAAGAAACGALLLARAALPQSFLAIMWGFQSFIAIMWGFQPKSVKPVQSRPLAFQVLMVGRFVILARRYLSSRDARKGWWHLRAKVARSN
ncbi:mate-domain-containing protein [Tribonema minus]|uniref:Mate-domain-containing protein n=1 Tax=Tribonema minus TaxID=303371 RepID=A0A835YHK4_9STRA|nr:mate-domain-containing protein [Tribonema minus]